MSCRSWSTCRAAPPHPSRGHARSPPLASLPDVEPVRAALALEVLPLLKAEARKRQVRKPGVVSAQMRSQEQEQKAAADAAELMGVSPRYVEQAARVAPSSARRRQ